MHPILADPLRLRLLFVSWGLVGGMLGLLVKALLPEVQWFEALLFGLPMGLVAAPVSLSAWYLCRAMPLDRTSAVRVGITALAAALVTAVLWAGLGQLWWVALERMQLVRVPAPIAILLTLLAGLGALAYLLSVTVHYMLQAFEVSAVAARQALLLQVAQRDAELRALRSQVDPHFLFNSLNSIAGLIPADPEKARQMCQLLGDFLRDSLTLGSSPRIPLAREVALAEQYLRVEQVRFGSRLTVRASVAPGATTVPVPPLILQPLVENAVRHGVATRLDGGLIEIAASRAGARAVVVVTNPRDPDLGRAGTGFGLDIVRRRLSASFGDEAALAIEPGPESYRVAVTMPIEDTND
jgi:two-component system, LytTR family, sensor histidine kinase AlgZ